MRIIVCTPFKPPDHPRVSGLVTIIRGLLDFLRARGHDVRLVPYLNTRWIYRYPEKWGNLIPAIFRTQRLVRSFAPHIWLTYHTYYKAPDILGPWMRRSFKTFPYVIFAGSYATKKQRSLTTWPGFMLNRHALLTAEHVMVNKHEDLTNLTRLLPREKLTYIRPGIATEHFSFDARARETLRARFAFGNTPVVVTAAMFRPGVKAEGIRSVIKSCARLKKQGRDLFLLILGDGPRRPELEDVARRHLPGRTIFAGAIPFEKMHRYYSCGDLFAFPGINESLGMVYLEAQSCGLPAVGTDHDGAPEVIAHKKTGLITPAFDQHSFTHAIGTLVENREMRRTMGKEAARFVRTEHDLKTNYLLMEKVLCTQAGEEGGTQSCIPNA